MNSGASGQQPAKKESSNDEPNKNTALRLFAVAVMDMSWQLALVVLIPIIGGYELDRHLNTTPWLLVLGFILASAGTYVVMKRMLSEYGNKTVGLPKDNKSWAFS